MPPAALAVLGVLLGIIALAVLLLIFNYGQIWFQAYWSKATVTFLELFGMSLRKVNARTIVQARIMATQAGLGKDISSNRLEAHYLAGGDVPRVIRALIAAHRAGIDLDFDRACAIDLAGRDVLDAVQTSVNPKVIDCPDVASGKSTLSAVARNGVELKIRARVTVRTNLLQLIGGATEETIIARVGEGIITSIGSAATHFEVMEHPDTISKAVLERGLDAQTAFQIVSIDIADIEVGENIGARLQADQAEADTRVARAKAEERPIMMTVSVAGTTELGTVDPVDEVNDLLRDYREREGIHIWHHVDAVHPARVLRRQRRDSAHAEHSERVAGLEVRLDARAAAFTGDNCMDWKGHIVGPNYAIQGNILLSKAILTGMEEGFLGTEGSLAEKLMAAMQGANVAGADARCLDEGVSSRSVFLRVAYPGDDPEDLTLDIVVAITPFGVEPIDVLQEEFNAWNGTSGLTEQNGDAPLLITRQAGGQVALKWGGPTPTDLIAFNELGARVGSVTLSGPWTTWQLPTDGTLFLRLVDASGSLLSTMQYSGRSPAPNTQGPDRE